MSPLLLLALISTAVHTQNLNQTYFLKRTLRAPLGGIASTPTTITFHKPRQDLVPQLSPLELAIDSTFGFVASEEASQAACQRIPGLTNHQRNLCHSNPGLIWALVDGMQLGLYECVFQFKSDRWNCSIARAVLGKPRGEAFLLNGNQSSAAGLIGSVQRTLKHGTRETAFVTAIWAAGAVQAVTRACSRGRISTCDCDTARRGGSKAADSEGDFTWGGCSDPIRFGMRLVRLFQETRLPQSQRSGRMRGMRQNSSWMDADSRIHEQIDDVARVLMDIHNQKVGRRFIWQSREKKCKCHGVSGACSLRTCWQRVGAFRGVGDLLKNAYNGALHVTFDASRRQLKRLVEPLYFGGLSIPSGHLSKRNANWFVVGGSGGGGGGGGRRTRQTSNRASLWENDKLVYLALSPDYCKADPTIGHLGVEGRPCDVDVPNSRSSCGRICCGRGYDTFEFEINEKCGCKFVWCCEVKCNICHRRTRVHRCKAESSSLSRKIDELLKVSSISSWMGQRRSRQHLVK